MNASLSVTLSALAVVALIVGDGDGGVAGTVYANSCAAGFTSITGGAGAGPICSAFCTPAETHNGSTANIDGVAPNDCAARGANEHECRFAWFMRSDGTKAEPELNRVGICVNPSAYLYDSNGDFIDDTVWPSCADLPDTDMDGDNIPEHEEWGCAPRTSF